MWNSSTHRPFSVNRKIHLAACAVLLWALYFGSSFFSSSPEKALAEIGHVDAKKVREHTSTLEAKEVEIHNSALEKLKKQPNVNLPDNVIFLHIGKAAGGTIQSRYNRVWNTHIKHCHPRPCIQPEWNTDEDAHPYIMLPLRDPIDRFDSAFYWRALRVCHPDPELQIPNYKELSGRDWECTKGNGHGYEAQAIHITYDQNASKLALDLCSPDQKLRKDARKAMSYIGHSQYNIRHWMSFEWQPERVYPIVVEKGFGSIQEQTDEAIRWIWNNTHFEEQSSFQRRSEYVAHNPASAPAQNSHSSTQIKKVLTAEAVECLRTFYQDDYEFLAELRQKACKTERCQMAIQSILNRRA